MTSVNIDGAAGIGSYAFKYCDSLEKVSLAAGLAYTGTMPFDSCASLHTIIVNGPMTNVPDNIVMGVPNALAIYVPHSSMADIKDNVATNRLKTLV